MFSSKIFMVLQLAFKSFTHFEFILYIFLSSSKEIFSLLLEEGREKHWCMREHWLVSSHRCPDRESYVLWQRMKPKPRNVLWPGTESAIFQLWDDSPANWATLARAWVYSSVWCKLVVYFLFFWHVVQFSQHHLLKRLFLLHCVFLPPLSNITWPRRCGLISGLCVPVPRCCDYSGL